MVAWRTVGIEPRRASERLEREEWERWSILVVVGSTWMVKRSSVSLVMVPVRGITVIPDESNVK